MTQTEAGSESVSEWERHELEAIRFEETFLERYLEVLLRLRHEDVKGAHATLAQAGIIPSQQAAEDLGYGPVQVERMRAMRRAQALDGLAVDLNGLAS